MRRKEIFVQLRSFCRFHHVAYAVELFSQLPFAEGQQHYVA